MKPMALGFIFCLVFVLVLAGSIDAQSGPGGIQAAYSDTEVAYSNGDLKLAATLMMPKGAGPFPAVVIIHGSGSSDRSNAWTSAYAKALVERGVAVLHPDKRGSGKSQGVWITATFLDLADDAIAGVELLRKAPGIDPKRIGVMGFSQGGHIAPAAASRSEHIAFAVNISGSVVPMMEQIMDEVELMAEREGLTPQQIQMVSEINRKAINFALTGSGGEEYLSALNEAKAGELKGKRVVQGFPTDPNHPSRTFVRTIGNFDPIPYWKNTKVPILFAYGGQDTQIRVRKSTDKLVRELGGNGNNYVLLLFGQNGHALFRKDLLDLIGSWISDKGAT